MSWSYEKSVTLCMIAKGHAFLFFKQFLNRGAKYLREPIQLNIRHGALLVFDAGNGTSANIDRKGLQAIREHLLAHFLLRGTQGTVPCVLIRQSKTQRTVPCVTSTIKTSEDLTTTLTWDILYGDGVVISAAQNGQLTSYTYGLERISAKTGSTP